MRYSLPRLNFIIIPSIVVTTIWLDLKTNIGFIIAFEHLYCHKTSPVFASTPERSPEWLGTNTCRPLVAMADGVSS